MNKFSLELRVGIFFLIAIGIIAYVWFKVLDLGSPNGFLLKAKFRSVEGISPGSQVQIAGIKVGSVKDITFEPDTGRAVVSLSLNESYRDLIPEGSRLMVKTRGLLGDRFLVIEPGKPNARKLKQGEEIKLVNEPTDTQKVLESLAVVSQDLQVITAETRRQIVDAKGAQKVDRILNNTDSFTKDALELITTNKQKINQTVSNADSALKGINEVVERNKPKVNKSVDDMESFSKNLDKTGTKFDRLASDLDSLTRDVKSGKGTLGKLITDESLHRDAQGLIRDFRGLSSRVQNGPGTIGRLINDPEIYFEARRAIRNMNKTAEEVSEVTPISTLAIILGSIFR
ncbi:MAG: MlaD family protein [Desulfomonilaceae bacterium]